MSEPRSAASSFDLAKIKRRAEGVEIADRMKDGTEIVFCGGDRENYIGWTPRETAEANGYAIHKTPREEAVLALVELAEAARAMVFRKETADGPVTVVEGLERLEAACLRFQ